MRVFINRIHLLGTRLFGFHYLTFLQFLDHNFGVGDLLFLLALAIGSAIGIIVSILTLFILVHFHWAYIAF